ncbi:unnamed protein product, partial [Rotaria sp. Silwood1]
PQFYLTFCSLSMSDLKVPEIAYKRSIEELELEMTQIDERKELTKKNVCFLFAGNKTKAETITEFLQLCIFPRCLLSEIDALYCADFMRVIHDLVTPNFSTIICYDGLIYDISYSIASCSENEAIRYGRFLESLLESVMSWHGDKNKFDKECATHSGFLTVFHNAGNTATKTTGTTQTPEQLDYDNFRHVHHKWHYKLAKSFIFCLDSNDYIQIRNVLQVLTVLLPIYPKMTTFHAALERCIKAISHKNRDTIEGCQFHSYLNLIICFFFYARPTSDKPMNIGTTNNGPTTAHKSASTAPLSQPTAPTSRSATITNIIPAEKRSRGGSSKGDCSTTSQVEESCNGSSRTNGGSSGSSSRRLNQTVESTLSTTPVHQDNEHRSGSGIMDVSPSSLSSKRIKTSNTVSNGRSTRKEAREDRHTSSSSSHRVSSSSRSDCRDKYHTSKATK